jgi:hypothetical protein
MAAPDALAAAHRALLGLGHLSAMEKDDHSHGDDHGDEHGPAR